MTSRGLVVLGLAVAAATADAHASPPPPPRLPPVVRACRQAKSSAALDTCLRRLGAVTVVRELPHARLFRIATGDVDLGLSLYIEDSDGWRIGGVYEAGARAYDVVEVAPLSVGDHHGYRIAIGELVHTPVSLDGVGTVPAVLALHREMLCAGVSWRCSEVIRACDVFVRGAALWTFHGTISIRDDEVHVAGDRKNSGAFCTVPETQFLGWPRT